jgi:hypothetical protein
MTNHDPVPSTSPEHRAPDGPRWIRDVNSQVDGRGALWHLTKSEQGGRVLHWKCYDAPDGSARLARTEVVAGHPHYPTDVEVVAAERAARRAAAELDRYV